MTKSAKKSINIIFDDVGLLIIIKDAELKLSNFRSEYLREIGKCCKTVRAQLEGLGSNKSGRISCDTVLINRFLNVNVVLVCL